jgi:uncharacterized protein YndB with AHSA1/START domain
MMIIQTNQFPTVSPELLYNAYLSSKEHGKMTSKGDTMVVYFRPGQGEVPVGTVGDELRAWGFKDQDGNIRYTLTATILSLVPGRLIVMRWKNLPWNLATNPALITDLESTLVLTFRKTAFGSEIQMVHVNVPDYEVRIPDTGETASLESIVNTHWGLQYWEPMKKYFRCNQ